MRLTNFCIDSRPQYAPIPLSELLHLDQAVVQHTSSVSGLRPVDRHEIVKEKSVEELNAQLVSLVGENGAEMLISAFRSRKSISGPELAALHSP